MDVWVDWGTSQSLGWKHWEEKALPEEDDLAYSDISFRSYGASTRDVGLERVKRACEMAAILV